MTSSLAWDISDTFNGLMMIPNLIGVFALSPPVIRITKNYINRKVPGKKEELILSYNQASLYLTLNCDGVIPTVDLKVRLKLLLSLKPILSTISPIL